MTLPVLAGLQLVNRLCLVGSALEAERGAFVASTALVAVASCAWAAERALGTFYRNRFEHRLAVRALHHVLEADPTLAGERRHYETILLGIFEAAKIEGQVKPSVVADILAAATVSVLAAYRGIGATLAVFLGGLAIGSFALIALRRRVEGASRRAWELRERYGQQILDGLEGAHELVTALPPGDYEERMGRSLDEQRRSSWLLALESLVIGRAPLAIAIVIAVTVTYWLAGFGGVRGVAGWAVLASMLPPFGGLATSAATYVETKAPIDAVRALLAHPLRSYGEESPERLAKVTMDGVSIRYGTTLALDAVDASFEGLVGITGPNGSGKSTLLRVLAGLVVPSTGTFLIDGIDQASIHWPTVRRRIAYLPQRPYFPPSLSVREAMRFLLGGTFADAELRARLTQVGLWTVLEEKGRGDPLGTPIDQLSAGERQRVALARVLARDAELVLLDEPDANLDRAGVEQLVEIVHALSRDGATVIIAAHGAALVDHVDVVLQFDRGRLADVKGTSSVRGGRQHHAGE